MKAGPEKDTSKCIWKKKPMGQPWGRRIISSQRSLSLKTVWPTVSLEVAIKPSARLYRLKAPLGLEKLLPRSVPGMRRETRRSQILPIPDDVGVSMGYPAAPSMMRAREQDRANTSSTRPLTHHHFCIVGHTMQTNPSPEWEGPPGRADTQSSLREGHLLGDWRP